MKSSLRSDEIYFGDEIKSVLSAVKRISSRSDFIHRRWIYSGRRTDLVEKKPLLSGRQRRFLFWSRVRESNPPPRLGKPMYYRCTNPAYELFDRALRDIREYSGGKAASVPLRMHVSQGAVIVASRARKCNHYLSCAKKVSGGAGLRRAFPVRFSPASPDRGTR